jgi:hypothetical protein
MCPHAVAGGVGIAARNRPKNYQMLALQAFMICVRTLSVPKGAVTSQGIVRLPSASSTSTCSENYA